MICMSSEMMIDKRLEEIIRTSSFVAKLKSSNTIYAKQVQELYETNKDKNEYCWNYVMYKWNMARNHWSLINPDTGSLFTVLTELNEGIQSIIKLEENNWLASIMKIKVDSFFEHSSHASIEDLLVICENQEQVPFQSYYIITYILISEVYYSIGEDEQAIRYLKKAEEKSQKITVLAELFKGMAIEYQNKLKREVGSYILLETINNILNCI